jgi:hypothetical protein
MEGRSKTVPDLVGEVKCPDPELYCSRAYPGYNKGTADHNCAALDYCNFNGECYCNPNTDGECQA